MSHPVAQTVAMILWRYLVDESSVDDPAATPPLTWPAYVGSRFPDTPDQAVSLIDTGGFVDGRVMTGEVQDHPGIQLRVRHRKPNDAHKKCTELADKLATMKRTTVIWNPGPSQVSYLVHNVSRRGSVNPIGPDKEGRTYSSTANFSVTVTLS